MSSCSKLTKQDGAPITKIIPRPFPKDAIPKFEKRSKYGNGPYYSVFGETYKVLESSYGYSERGVASWYGTKFHGRPTSSGEIYDMYAMTAAHKSLPLPTYVKVKNLNNNKSVIVKVNDRGPFVDNRLIDLSYNAARKLDMINSGTSLVEITAISFDMPHKKTVNITNLNNNEEPSNDRIFLQIGAFNDWNNAKNLLNRVKALGYANTQIDEDLRTIKKLYRVKIGPIKNVETYDKILKSLETLNIRKTHLVTNCSNCL